jgi:O-acetyl-ADP-ribose deacetylase (regulator of RNase III)
VRSILFPLLGTGMAGAAIKPTARTMLLAVLDHLVQRPDTPLRQIAFLAYSERERTALHQVLRELPVDPVSLSTD